MKKLHEFTLLAIAFSFLALAFAIYTKDGPVITIHRTEVVKEITKPLETTVVYKDVYKVDERNPFQGMNLPLKVTASSASSVVVSDKDGLTRTFLSGKRGTFETKFYHSLRMSYAVGEEIIL